MEVNENTSGFRLDYMEIYNWGTFDRTVARITPNTSTSLMTGANGSGKTTLVDALLTLLVPNQKRFYNQSSGAEQKKERSEESYVLGEFGRTRDEDELEAKKKHHRNKQDYSVLLACFVDPSTKDAITLCQVRWFSSGGELQRSYIVSSHALTVMTDIKPFDQRGEWRKRLKRTYDKTETYDSFRPYGRDFVDRFGMRSEKALTLFNKTVGIKVLGDLNSFIRGDMLEEGDHEEDFQQLREQYQTLLDTHRNILKAQRQLQLLEPVIVTGTEYEKAQEEIQHLEHIQSTLPFYFNDQELIALHEASSEIAGQIRDVKIEIEERKKEKELCDERVRTLQNAIDNNEESHAIRAIETHIKLLEESMSPKKKAAITYNEFALKIGLATPESSESFVEQRKQCENENRVLEL